MDSPTIIQIKEEEVDSAKLSKKKKVPKKKKQAKKKPAVQEEP